MNAPEPKARAVWARSWRRVGRWPPARRLLVMGLCAALAAGGGHALILLPAEAQSKRIHAALAESRQQAALKRAAVRKKARAIAGRHPPGGAKSPWRKHLPRKDSTDDLLKPVSALARARGLLLTQWRALPPRGGSFYRVLPLRLKLEGSYSDLLNFLRAMGRSTLAFTVDGLALRTQNNARPPRLGINLLLSTYCCAQNGTATATATTATRGALPRQTDLPFPHKAEPFAHEGQPSSREARPFTHEVKPFTYEAEPFSDEAKPFTHEAEPFTYEAEPFTHEAKPFAHEAQPLPKAVFSGGAGAGAENTVKKSPFSPRFRVFPVHFADAAELAKLLRQSFPQKNVALSVDRRTNALIAHGEDSLHEKIGQALALLDIPVRQVMIEGMIAVVRKDDNHSLGVSWEAAARETKRPGRDEFLLEAGEALDASIQLGFVEDYGQLRAQLRALHNVGRGRIVSRPHLITGNRKTAFIKSGTRIPFQESAPNGRTTLRFTDAVLLLAVTPIITPNDKILLKLSVNQDAPGAVVATGEGRAPSIDTTELQTQVLLSEGQTVALGGVFRDEETNMRSQIPLLGNLPVIGELFRHERRGTVRAETLIFITPHILPGE